MSNASTLKTWLLRIGVAVLLLVLLAAAYAYYQMRSRGFWRMPSYDTVAPVLPELPGKSILVFSKTGQFIHKESMPVAEQVVADLAKKNGWSVFITENGAVHNPLDLAKFDAIFWNNVTGDVLNEAQQIAFKNWLESGGGWLGVHGSGDTSGTWQWYNNTLIGAQFIGHPMNPQFQEATLNIESPDDPIMNHLGATWVHTDEWYSYDESPRKNGVTVLATLDETTYQPIFFKDNIAMGDDHPIIWKRCVGSGRAFYSALGHSAESMADSKHVQMLENAIQWAMLKTDCQTD